MTVFYPPNTVYPFQTCTSKTASSSFTTTSAADRNLEPWRAMQLAAGTLDDSCSTPSPTASRKLPTYTIDLDTRLTRSELRDCLQKRRPASDWCASAHVIALRRCAQRGSSGDSALRIEQRGGHDTGQYISENEANVLRLT